MYLTKEEEKMLNSENESMRKSMEILIAVGKIFGAERFVEIKSAQISGVSYKNIGDAGLEWLESINARVKVKTLLNPAGMDLERYMEMGIDNEFYKKQMRIIKAFKKMGVKLSLTCTPYYICKPSFGDHLAWAESSAVIYANSVIGARTNRESGITALASAITGRTPLYGMHIKENRKPTIYVKAKKTEPAIAGLELGNVIKDEIPLIKFDFKLNDDQLKAFGAALASTSSLAIFHIENQTPEWKDFEKPKEKIEIDTDIVKKGCDPDLIAIGCPHLSANELIKIAHLIDRYGKVRRELWIFTSKHIKNRMLEIVKKIENSGAKVFTDTCIVVSPIADRFNCIMTNSGKALEYLPKLRAVNVVFANIEKCIRIACNGG